MNSISEISHYIQCVKYAHGLINEENKWIKGVLAKKEGEQCSWWDRKADQYSLYGALRRCCPFENDFEFVGTIVQEYISRKYQKNIVSFNDDVNTEYKEITNLLFDVINIMDQNQSILRIGKISVNPEMRYGWKHDAAEVIGIGSQELAYYIGYMRGNKNKMDREIRLK